MSTDGFGLYMERIALKKNSIQGLEIIVKVQMEKDEQ